MKMIAKKIIEKLNEGKEYGTKDIVFVGKLEEEMNIEVRETRDPETGDKIYWCKKRVKTTLNKLKDIKKKIEKENKFDDDMTLAVKIYECEEEKYTVEIHLSINGDFVDGYNTEIFEELKDAKKRASEVKRTIKKWFSFEEYQVLKEIEKYHA